MKAILLLLLTCLPLWAATTYPMLSDTTNRTVTGGVTNLSFLNSNSVFTGTARWMGIATLTNTGNIFVGDGSGLTGVGVATSGGLATNLTATGLTVATGQTNTHLTASSIVTTDANKGIVSGTTTADLATLSANQTFTGTNTFPAASFYTANNIGIRKLWSCATNIYVAGVATNSAATNAGNFATISQLAEVTVPALLRPNSAFSMSVTLLRTNISASAALLYLYVGTNTNFISQLQIGGTAVGVSTELRPAGVVYWVNNHSFTTQMQAGTGTYYNTPSNFVDTSVPFKVYVGLATATSHTNLQVLDVSMFESVR